MPLPSILYSVVRLMPTIETPLLNLLLLNQAAIFSSLTTKYYAPESNVKETIQMTLIFHRLSSSTAGDGTRQTTTRRSLCNTLAGLHRCHDSRALVSVKTNSNTVFCWASPLFVLTFFSVSQLQVHSASTSLLYKDTTLGLHRYSFAITRFAKQRFDVFDDTSGKTVMTHTTVGIIFHLVHKTALQIQRYHTVSYGISPSRYRQVL